MTNMVRRKNTWSGLIVVSFFILIVLLSNLKGISNAPATENLGCSSLSDCSSKASCNEKGMSTGCLIECKSGATINCPSRF